MDPPLINETSFSTANPSSYTLTGIWPYTSLTGGETVGERSQSDGGLGLRMANLGAYGERDGSAEESTVTDQSYGNGGGRKKRTITSEGDSSKLLPTTSSARNNDLNDMDPKRIKGPLSSNENVAPQSKVELGLTNTKKLAEKNKQCEPPKDYIHVRARRGQATDSHSLAERARREKISERMKILQDLVPGCNKIIGKALVLDEIINYIQSLQRQVEFLSMKLEAVNSRIYMHSPVEGLPSKELGIQPFDASGALYLPQTSRGMQPQWLHMQATGNFERP